METVEAVKRCSKCGVEKPLGEFCKAKLGKYGVRGECKACMREYQTRYRAENKDKRRSWQCQWRQRNPEYQAKYYAKNRDKWLAYYAKYYAENRDIKLEYAAKYRARYRAENRDKERKRKAKYYAENKDKRLAYTKRWQRANPDKRHASKHRRRARKLGNGGTHTAAEMREQFTRQKGICYYCDHKLIHPFQPKPKTTTKRVAHWEHIIPLARGGRNDLSNLVWACMDCNLSKHDKLLGIEWKAPNGRLI